MEIIIVNEQQVDKIINLLEKIERRLYNVELFTGVTDDHVENTLPVIRSYLQEQEEVQEK